MRGFMNVTTALKLIGILVSTAGVGLIGMSQLQAQPALTVIGLTSKNTLVRFGSNRIVPVTGIDGNLQGIDFRPADGQLYGVTDTDKVYTIDPNNGLASQISVLKASFDGGFQSGFDFNPVPNLLRVVGSNDQNLRFDPNTGDLRDFDPNAPGIQPDMNLAYADGDPNYGVNPNVTAIAYTNAVAGATTTQLFGIDYDRDVLVLQDPPNNGTLKTIGQGLGINFAPTAGFDIATAPNGTNFAFAVSGGTLYSVDTNVGVATRLGTMPEGGLIGLATRFGR
jgi:Domain of unknown function (DUF4394)